MLKLGVTDHLLQAGSFRAAHAEGSEPAQTLSVGSVRAGRPLQLLIQLDSQILTGCDISATKADRRGSGSVVVVSVKGKRIRLGTQVEVIIHGARHNTPRCVIIVSVSDVTCFVGTCFHVSCIYGRFIVHVVLQCSKVPHGQAH